MAALSGQRVNAVLGGVCIFPNNTGVTGTIQTITDGAGLSTALGLSTNYVQCGNVKFNGTTLTLASGTTFTITPNTSISGTLAVMGNTTLSGTLGVTGNTTIGGTLGITGIATFTATPVFSLGVGEVTATSVNKVALTAPATGSTLTIADGKTLTASNTLTLTGTDSSSVAFGGGGTVAYTTATQTLTNKTFTTPTVIGSNGFNVVNYSDAASSTDYWQLQANVNNSAKLQLISSQTNASASILAKGTGGFNIGSTGACTVPVAWQAGSNTYAQSIPTLTGNRTVTWPDSNVTISSSAQAIMSFGISGTIADGATNYLTTTGATGTDSSAFATACPFAGTITSLFCAANNAIAGTRTYTLMKNGSTTTLTCASTAGASTCNDTAHTVTVAAGDLLCVRCVMSGGATTSGHQTSISIRPT